MEDEALKVAYEEEKEDETKIKLEVSFAMIVGRFCGDK